MAYYNLNVVGCSRCGPTTPHQVIFRCSCGQSATGRTDHIWLLEEHDGGLVSFTPSVNWLLDPKDASKGSHVHEFAQNVRVASSLSEVCTGAA